LAMLLMVATLIWLGDQYNAFDASLWQRLGWWQRSSAVACICLGGFAVYTAILGIGGMRLSDLKGPAKATTSTD
jgi:putative peptidoglycan lipid II flippase